MKTRTILRLTLLTLGCAAVLWPGETNAQRRGFEAPDPRLQKSERRTTEQFGQAVRLHGKVQVTRRGVQLGGQPLVLTATTTVFPGSGDLSSPHLAKRLRGEEATVYGRRTARGVGDAVLRPAEHPPHPTSDDEER